jgi:gliding motility associated protien GldN
MGPGISKEFTVSDCFKNLLFSGKFKADTLRANYMIKGFKVWRAIGLDNKQNGVLFNSGNKCVQVGLFEIIKFGLFEKKLNAFSSDDFNRADRSVINYEDLPSLFTLKDSSENVVFDAAGNSSSQIQVVNRYLNSADIKGYLIKEDWVLNNYSGKMEKYMIAIAPMVYDSRLDRVQPLLWLFYSEWEELLASFEARNYYSYERVTYKDVFQKKYFVSVVSKESNVFDRRVTAYSHGDDAYFESERIKEKMNNSENDLFQH